MLVDDIIVFLEENGYANVYRTLYPPDPAEIISVHEREGPMALGPRSINYGMQARPIQIRVRREKIEDAEAVAWKLFDLFDSGPDEETIQLTEERTVTARPRVPFFFELDERRRGSYSLKLTVHTNKP